MSRRRPRVHPFSEGGGMVTRCDDPRVALELMLEYQEEEGYLDAGEAREAFTLESAKVSKGRIVVQPPGGDYAWMWHALPDSASGPGVTTAVVWDSLW